MAAAAAAAAVDESEDLRGAGGAVSLSEWQAWGTASLVPAMVSEVIEGLTALKNDTDAPMTFGGIGGKLQCWIAAEDCMCSKLAPVSLWHGIRFWVYMHPKDFLRQNNTGKLLWQLFGIKAASLCLFGIPEHEDIMWDAFKHSGKNMVWFLYPNKTLTPHSVQDVFVDRSFTNSEGQIVDLGEKPLNFVLIDGTWSNSAAMYRRLKDRWTSEWGDEDPPSVSLSTTGLSAMHKLRPQPAWDRTCTAAAAAGLLSELHLHPQFNLRDLDKQAESVEEALDALLDALTTRRLRKGRSIARRERKSLS